MDRALEFTLAGVRHSFGLDKIYAWLFIGDALLRQLLMILGKEQVLIRSCLTMGIVVKGMQSYRGMSAEYFIV